MDAHFRARSQMPFKSSTRLEAEDEDQDELDGISQINKIIASCAVRSQQVEAAFGSSLLA